MLLSGVLANLDHLFADLDSPLQLIELFIEAELDLGLGKLADTIKHKSLRKRPDQLIFQLRSLKYRAFSLT